MKIGRYTGFLILILLTVPLSWNALTYLNFDFTYGFLKLKQQAIETGWYLPAYYAHILAAAVILIIGIFQINNIWRVRWPKLHRILGKVYVGGILFLSAPGGLIMSFFIQRGPLVLISFVLQCTAWFVFTYLAYYHIRKGNIALHRNWMFRSYSLTLAAVTLRLYVFIGSWSFDLSQPKAYATIAWLSWIVNLLVCELFLMYRKKNTLVTG